MPIPAREARPDAFLDRVIATAFRATACILNGPRRYVHRVPTSSRFPGSEPAINATIDELKGRGAEVSKQVTDEGWGLLTSIKLPGGSELGLYEPRHPTVV